MEQEIIRWFKQAERDLISARNSFHSKDYYVCAFMSQQAVEKGLKSLMLKSRKELIRTHSVVRIGKFLDLPKTLLEKVVCLEPVYQESRYPDVSDVIPAEEFDLEDAENFLNIATEVIEWIRQNLQ